LQFNLRGGGVRGHRDCDHGYVRGHDRDHVRRDHDGDHAKQEVILEIHHLQHYERVNVRDRGHNDHDHLHLLRLNGSDHPLSGGF
jgi:hypothetical protein